MRDFSQQLFHVGETFRLCCLAFIEVNMSDAIQLLTELFRLDLFDKLKP